MAREQRRNERYQVRNGAYAAFGREYTGVGKINDISLGGLSFVSINHVAELSSNDAVITIYLAGNGFYLPDLPCRVVHRTPLQEYKEFHNASESIKITIYGVEFGDLGERKKERLKVFLESYTAGRE